MVIQDLPGRLGEISIDTDLPSRDDLGTVFDELDHQLACQVYLWSLPLVSYQQWSNQHRDVFGATSSDVVHYVSYRDRLGLITANATTPYVLNFFDLHETGPLVIEIPAGHLAGGLSDFWQREIGAVGEMGPDAGRGGRHLVVAPDQAVPEDAPDHFVHRSTGVRIMFGFRTLDPDEHRARALVDAVRVYPYDRRDDPPPTRVISPGGRRWDGDQPRGLEYFRRLHEAYQDEVVDERDRFYLAMLAQLGIVKGEPFAPDARLVAILTEAARVGELMAQANAFAKRFAPPRWPDRRWDQALALDRSSQRAEHHDQLLERAAWSYEAVSPSAAMRSTTPGVGQACLSTYTDARGEWLDGRHFYTLHVPAPVPAKNFWSVSLYDVTSRCLVDNDQQRGDRGSRDLDLVREEDGSVHLFFGPVEPVGHTSNWVQTIPGRHWFCYLRLYGPLEAYLDHTWKPGDVVRAD